MRMPIIRRWMKWHSNLRDQCEERSENLCGCWNDNITVWDSASMVLEGNKKTGKIHPSKIKIELTLFNKTLKSPLDSTEKPTLTIYWKNWCSSWSSNTVATSCKEPTYWKRSCWFWERLKAGGEKDDRGWDGWMVPPIQWTWAWANSGRLWRTEKPGVLYSMGVQRVGHDWVTEQQQPWFMNWIGSNPANRKGDASSDSGGLPHYC